MCFLFWYSIFPFCSDTQWHTIHRSLLFWHTMYGSILFWHTMYGSILFWHTIHGSLLFWHTMFGFILFWHTMYGSLLFWHTMYGSLLFWYITGPLSAELVYNRWVETGDTYSCLFCVVIINLLYLADKTSYVSRSVPQVVGGTPYVKALVFTLLDTTLTFIY